MKNCQSSPSKITRINAERDVPGTGRYCEIEKRSRSREATLRWQICVSQCGRTFGDIYDDRQAAHAAADRQATGDRP